VKLPRPFYARPCLQVARAMIGTWLVHDDGTRLRQGRIVETEAYIGTQDQASHARFGPTERNRVMFGPPGYSYVFLIYGMYDCFNVVCERDGRPAAVLVRALEPGEGADGRTDGPGRLTRAIGISRAHDRLDLCANHVWLERREGPRPRIVATERIGVDYAGDWARKKWRFVDAKSTHLSRRLP
jgi:DNA-3-methyladenine glycosylase